MRTEFSNNSSYRGMQFELAVQIYMVEIFVSCSEHLVKLSLQLTPYCTIKRGFSLVQMKTNENNFKNVIEFP